MNEYFENHRKSINNKLDELLPKSSQKVGNLFSAMRYSMLNGGKRIRPLLCIAAADSISSSNEATVLAASAIEMMHVYSLIHDDLPSMDNDDLRRGLPTVHIKWDEATAILTGDALQCKAFEILAMPETHPDGEKRSKLIYQMSLSAGVGGMVSGQEADISAEINNTILSLEDIIKLQDFKTGALIRWSGITGPLLAGQSLSKMENYANSLGLAFQIQDDILDIEGIESKVGKKTQKDRDAGKVTFISLLGLNEAKKKAKLLIEDACETISDLGPKSSNLIKLAKFVINRSN